MKKGLMKTPKQIYKDWKNLDTKGWAALDEAKEDILTLCKALGVNHEEKVD